MRMHDIAAVILVGGKSSRMGQDKASLPYRGKRLVDIVADSVREAGMPIVYVSGKLEGYMSIPDSIEGQGPVGGICTCIRHLAPHYKRALFIPVDMPHLSPQLVQWLAGQSTDLPCYAEGNPMPCVIPLNQAALLQAEKTIQRLASGVAISVKTLLAEMNAIALCVPDELKHALTNTNTPQEWKEATHEYSHQ